ncbi:MAG: DUF3526 domain-containing protein, partial [Myxococcota bacterium]
TEEKFTWAWYFAMQENADAHVKPMRCEIERDYSARSGAVATLAFLSPSVAFEHFLTTSAHTSLSDQIAYRNRLRAFHSAALNSLHAPIFADATFSESLAEGIPLFSDVPSPGTPYCDGAVVGPRNEILGLTALALVLQALALSILVAWKAKRS